MFNSHVFFIYVAYLIPYPPKNVGGPAAVEGARTVGVTQVLCHAHQTVVRPAHTIQGCEIARHDVENIRPWQPVCDFVEDLRRQLLFWMKLCLYLFRVERHDGVQGFRREGQGGKRVV